MIITVPFDLAGVCLLHEHSRLCHVVFLISEGGKIDDEVSRSEEQVDGEEYTKRIHWNKELTQVKNLKMFWFIYDFYAAVLTLGYNQMTPRSPFGVYDMC